MDGQEGDSDDEAPNTTVQRKAYRRSSFGMTNSLQCAEMDAFDEDQQYEDSMAELAHLKELERMVRTMYRACVCTVVNVHVRPVLSRAIYLVSRMTARTNPNLTPYPTPLYPTAGGTGPGRSRSLCQR